VASIIFNLLTVVEAKAKAIASAKKTQRRYEERKLYVDI
jgi:hypothetical protein